MARDTFHEIVKEALIKDGWLVTDDPLTLLSRAEGGISTDLGAEKIIVAEKGLTKIAVEVKSFLNPSMIHDFLRASGQYNGYNIVIKRKQINRILYLAMPIFAYEKLISYEFIQDIIEDVTIKFILFDEKEKIIIAWKE
jgi:XisH protein